MCVCVCVYVCACVCVIVRAGGGAQYTEHSIDLHETRLTSTYHLSNQRTVKIINIYRQWHGTCPCQLIQEIYHDAK